MKELIQQIKDILHGIDLTEDEDSMGWWETSEQAKFGKNKLNEIINIVKNYKGEIK